MKGQHLLKVCTRIVWHLDSGQRRYISYGTVEFGTWTGIFGLPKTGATSLLGLICVDAHVQGYPLPFEFFRHVYWLPRYYGGAATPLPPSKGQGLD